jgi:hypothetical protein
VKLELKEYQEEAVAKVVSGLRKGTDEFAADGEHAAVSLSAPTGAGKTVVAAAVMERMLFGDPDGMIEEDPKAIFLWLTDDPSLNEQTRKKILEASDRLGPSHLVTLDDGFDQPEFDNGRIYFLNIQKLSKNSNLVNRKEGKRNFTLWETISSTIIENGTHYIMIVDEAHRGTGRRSSDDTTIAQRLLNGNGVVKAAPVVLGISATPERFETAITSGAQDRLLRKVTVPVLAVRESGLIKDVLSVSYQAEKQTMEFTLLREAVTNLREIDEAWDAYTKAEDEPPVRAALVLQIPPSAPDAEVSALLDVLVEEWDILGRKFAIAHSLESHTVQQFGNKHLVHYVAPQDIQDHPSVRVVLFKEALTTGWDCPRAEVMVSLRAAKDGTYIAQLIGRMVRSPLARRIESDETLNRVRLYLPNFNKAAVESVKAQLESGEGVPTEIEINSVDAPRNTSLDDSVFAAVEALPSYQVPGPVHRSQVARLHKLAALLTGDKIITDAIKAADGFLVAILNAERDRLEADETLAGLVEDAETANVEVMNIEADGTTTTTQEVFSTDINDVDRLFAKARRKFRDGLAETYWAYRVSELDQDPIDAKTLVVALSTDSATVDAVEEAASDRVRQWLDTHGDTIAGLSEDKKAKYAEVRAMARSPEVVHPGLPEGPITMSGDEDVATYEDHLYCDSAGLFRVRLGSWEQHVLAVEGSRNDFAAWYRNPTGGQRALRIPFETSEGYGKLYPDFVVLQTGDDGKALASIVDPHGHHLADAGDKLRGLGAYAEKHGGEFGRIIAVIRNTQGEFRMLDLKDATIRTAIKGVHGKEAIEQVFADHGSVYA